MGHWRVTNNEAVDQKYIDITQFEIVPEVNTR